MIVKVVTHTKIGGDVDGGSGVKEFLTQRVYDKIVSHIVEYSYGAHMELMNAFLTIIDGDGLHTPIDLFKSTVYIMNDEGKTIDKYMQIERVVAYAEDQGYLYPTTGQGKSKDFSVGIDGITLGNCSR